jgi:hypothetical protein
VTLEEIGGLTLIQDYYELVTYKQPTPTTHNKCVAIPDMGKTYSSDYYAVAACEGLGTFNRVHRTHKCDSTSCKPYETMYTFARTGTCDATTLASAASIKIENGYTADDCAGLCAADPTPCLMFSYDKATNKCQLFNADVSSTCTWATPDYTTVGAMKDYYTIIGTNSPKPTADGCANPETMDW